MVTKEQVEAFEKIKSILEPPVIASLASGSTRESWKQIDALIEILKPLFDQETNQP